MKGCDMALRVSDLQMNASDADVKMLTCLCFFSDAG